MYVTCCSTIPSVSCGWSLL